MTYVNNADADVWVMQSGVSNMHMATSYLPDWKVEEIRAVPGVAEGLVKHTWRSSTSSMREVAYRYDVAAELKHLAPHITVLFIHGDRHLIARLAAIERLAAAQTVWRFRVLQCIDHHPFVRDPGTCVALIAANENK